MLFAGQYEQSADKYERFPYNYEQITSKKEQKAPPNLKKTRYKPLNLYNNETDFNFNPNNIRNHDTSTGERVYWI